MAGWAERTGKQILQGECRNGMKRGVFQNFFTAQGGVVPKSSFPPSCPERAHGKAAYEVRFFPFFHASHGRLVETQDPGSNINWLALNCVRNTWDLALICFVCRTENFIQTKWARIVDGGVDGQHRALYVAPHSSAVQLHHCLHLMLPTDKRKNQLMQISSVSSLQGISLLRNSLKSTVPEIEKHHLTRKGSYGKQDFDSFTCFLNTGKGSQ